MFRKTYRLPFRLLGIPLELDFTFLLVLPLFAWIISRNIPAYVETFGLEVDAVPLQEGLTPLLLGFVAVVGLFVSIVIHELGHSVVGRHFGMEITSITLWILGGVARFKSISRRPGVEAWMAIAGPLTSYALGGLFWGILQVLPTGLHAAIFVASYLMWMNVILATFNLLPALPLDGGRVLRSLLALKMGHLEATRSAAGVSRFFAFLLGIAGFATFNVLLVLVAFFVLLAGTAESQFATVGAALQGIRVRDLMTSAVQTVPPSLPVPELLERMFEQKHLAYPVVGAGGVTLGVVTLRDLEHPPTPERKDPFIVQDVMAADFETVRADDSAFDAFKRISEHASGRLLVTDRDRRLEGIVSKTDLVQAIQLRLVERTLDGGHGTGRFGAAET